jgi:Tfp pilus assembly protein PilN
LMASRSLGIDIGPTTARAVQLVRVGRQMHLEQICHVEWGETEADGTEGPAEAGNVVSDLVRKGSLRTRVATAVNAPGDRVFFLRHVTDLPQLGQVRRVLPFELEDDLPLPVDEVVVDVESVQELGEGRRSLLVAAAARNAVRDRADLLAQAGLRCDVVTADVPALLASVLASHPEARSGSLVVVMVRDGEVRLGIAQDGALVAARGLSAPRSAQSDGAMPEMPAVLARAVEREIQISWRDTFGGSVAAGARVVVGGEPGPVEELVVYLSDELPCRVVPLDLSKSIHCFAGGRLPPDFAVAAGLASRAAAGKRNGLNFLAADEREADRAAAMRRGLATFAALLFAVVAVWVADVFLRLGAAERRNEEVEREVSQVLTETVPDAAAVPGLEAKAAVMEERLGALQREHLAFASVAGEGLSPLRVLYEISARIPGEIEVEVVGLTMDARLVTIRGKTDSHRSVEAIRAVLSEVPGFASVDRGATDWDRDGRPTFELKVTVAAS